MSISYFFNPISSRAFPITKIAKTSHFLLRVHPPPQRSHEFQLTQSFCKSHVLHSILNECLGRLAEIQCFYYKIVHMSRTVCANPSLETRICAYVSQGLQRSKLENTNLCLCFAWFAKKTHWKHEIVTFQFQHVHFLFFLPNFKSCVSDYQNGQNEPFSAPGTPPPQRSRES